MQNQNQPLRHEDKKAQKLIQKITQKVSATTGDKTRRSSTPVQPRINLK